MADLAVIERGGVTMIVVEVRCRQCGKKLAVVKTGGQYLQIKCPRCSAVNEHNDLLSTPGE